MNKFLGIVLLVTTIFTSCATAINPNVDYVYPQIGNINNSNIATKDYEPIDIIFVKSSEVIDGDGNHTGSKITYEMLMLEAKNIDAHDVINVRIDVNKIDEIIKGKNGYDISRTTYNYTASALAIKYTTVIAIDNNINNLNNFNETMIISKQEKKGMSSKNKKIGIAIGVAAIVIGGIIGIGAIYSSNNID